MHPSEHPTFASRAEHLRSILERHPMPLFAVLDAARNEEVLPTLRREARTYRSLYEGWQGDGLAEVAPYLVELAPDVPLLETLTETAWGDSWGVYLFSDASFADLRRHLRRSLKVRTEDGRSLLFRWYDPRVLRAYLPTCDADEARAFFGPVAWAACEGRDGREFLRYMPTAEGVRTDAETLTSRPPS
jgi:hypothetical protein